MKALYFTVPGIPRPQKRPMVLRRGWAIDPPESAREKRKIGLLARAEMGKRGYRDLFFGGISIRLYFYGANKLSDIDNLTKLVFDALNKIVWKDDRQVLYMASAKLDCDKGNERTHIEIQEDA